MKIKIFSVTLVALVVSLIALVSCGPKPPGLEDQIAAAVRATVAAIPSPTAVPLPTPNPSPTPFELKEIFCEYGFCIGHPTEINFFDVSVVRNSATPSTHGYGILAGYSAQLFIQLVWTGSGGSFDPQTTMRYVLEEGDAQTGSLDIQLVGDLNVYYQPITTTVSPILPFGAVATWQCGSRDFAWKVYTPQDGMAASLLQDALKKFRCE
jgi:hypothetical protein